MDKDVKLNLPPRWSGKLIASAIAAIIVVVTLLSTFYAVGPDEVAVIKRLGRYIGTTDPGLHAKVPFIDTAVDVKVRRIFKEEFGFRTVEAGVKTVYAPDRWQDESLMLTGDLNVAVVEWIVQYQIVDPYAYLFRIRRPVATIRDMSEVVMRQVVGDRSVDEILTVGRVEAAARAQVQLQEIMDSFESGIRIVTLKLKDVNPPDPVKPAFNEVNEARQDKERYINEAWRAYNKVIPRARGEAEKTVAEAEGYAIRRVNQADGDSDRFLALLEEYQKAKAVTRRRLYLESLTKVLARVGKVYVLDSQQEGILPLLPLQGGGIK